MRLVAFMVCAFGVAINVVAYAYTSNPLNLGSMVFCGLVALFNLVAYVSDRSEDRL